MTTFIARLKGYDTMEYGSVMEEIEINAETKEEAEIKAKQWCKEHSTMGGYDWYVNSINRKEEN